ncbi:MAG: hypothetical protein O3B75_08325 [Planctomycetota bacterium]|nr:hypothetical protein [Planctomycetota bacterium]
MIALNHLGMLQRVRTVATQCFSLAAAAIVLLSFSSSYAHGTPQSIFDAPISSRECRDRLRSFGASDAGIELSMPAIEAYIKLAIERNPAKDNATTPLLLSPLDLNEATDLQNRIQRQLAECDSADTQLSNGISSAMRNDADQQAAERFQKWLNLRRDKLFFTAAGIDVKPITFSAENALVKIDPSGTIRASLRPQLEAHSASIVRMSRTARNLLLETPIRTARLAKSRSISASMNPAESPLGDADQNLEIEKNPFQEWKRSMDQVRSDGFASTSEAFQKIGLAQRAFIEQIGSQMNSQAIWGLWKEFYNRSYPNLSIQFAMVRKPLEDSAKALRKSPGIDPELLATVTNFEKQWRLDSLLILSNEAMRYDEGGWNSFIKQSDFTVLPNNDFRSDLADNAEIFQNQINKITIQNPTKVIAKSPTANEMSSESIQAEIETSFGTLCGANSIALVELNGILDATEATADQRLLALQLRQDSAEDFIRSNDRLTTRWFDVGARTIGSNNNPGERPSVADFQEIAAIRQESLHLERNNSDRFFSQLSSIVATAPKGSLLETYREANLRNIERNLIQCMLDQIEEVQFEPLWRVDIATIVRGIPVDQMKSQVRDSITAILNANNKELLPPMRKLSDALIAFLAMNKIIFASDYSSELEAMAITTRSIEEDAENPQVFSTTLARMNQQAAELMRCNDASKEITAIQKRACTEISQVLPPKNAKNFIDVFRRTAYPTLAKFLGGGDALIIRALELTEIGETKNQIANDAIAQAIIELASAYGPASEAIFLTAVEQQAIIDAGDDRKQSAMEKLRQTLFVRQELDASLHRDLQRVLGPELALQLKQK